MHNIKCTLFLIKACIILNVRSAGRRPRLLNLSTMTVEAIKTMTSTSTVINPTVTMTVMVRDDIHKKWFEH